LLEPTVFVGSALAFEDVVLEAVPTSLELVSFASAALFNPLGLLGVAASPPGVSLVGRGPMSSCHGSGALDSGSPGEIGASGELDGAPGADVDASGAIALGGAALVPCIAASTSAALTALSTDVRRPQSVTELPIELSLPGAGSPARCSVAGSP
jgi:hypothetical protein